MAARFCVLASGSSGNCVFVQSDGFGFLIDFGIGPRFIASRLAAVGATWRDVHAVFLTHTHTDHWKELTLAIWLARETCSIVAPAIMRA